MTPGQQKQKLQGQPSITQKIFDHVPIQDAWTSPQISQSLARQTGARMDAKTVGRCIRELLNAGLVRAVTAGHYQRLPVSRAAETQIKPIATTEEIIVMTAPEAPKPASAIDLLAGIAQKLRAAANDIDAAAISIEEGQTKNSEDTQKLRQLQALLKSL